MIGLLQEWVMARLIKLAVAGVGVSLVVGSCVVRDQSLQRRGAVKAVAKIERATGHAISIGKRGAAGTVDSRVRGIVDPTTRND